MAVKRKISKADYEALSDDKKEFYVENKDRKGEYILDMDADFNKELTDAHERVKAENASLKTKNEELTAELETEKTKKAPKDGSVTKEDHDAMKNSYEKKLSDKDKAHGEAIAKKDKFIKNSLVDAKALELATKISKPSAVKLMLPHVKARLQADLEGDDPKTVVLDADGKPSAYTLEDLSQELVANADFADIVIGSKASGGNAPAGGGGNAPNGNPPNNRTASLTDLPAEQLVAHMKSTHSDLR